MSAPTSTPNTYGMITKYQLYQERRLSVTVVTRDAELHTRMTGVPVIPAPLRANAGERLLSDHGGALPSR